MATLFLITRMVFAELAALVLRPPTLLVAGGLLLLIYWQYRRVADTEEELYGLPKNAPLQHLGDAVVFGVLGGVAGSLLAAWSGTALVQPAGAPSPVLYLWPVALLLSLINPRYICFSYAATVVGLGHLLTGWPRVDIPTLLSLVALLHLVEAFLIWTGGAACTTPLIMETRRGEAAPVFQLQRYWPVPLILPMAFAGAGLDPETVAAAVDMPDWWPIIRPDPRLVSGMAHLAYTLVPVVVVVGYGDLAVTERPESRARRAAGQLALYSLALLVLAVWGAHWRPALWIGIIFSAAAHEWLIVRSLRRQLAGIPFLQAPHRGVGVLDVLPGSIAALAGLRPGSVILEVSGQAVSNRNELHEALTDAPYFLQLVYKNGWQLESARIQRPEEGLMTFGAILLPEPGDPPMVALRPGLITRLVRALIKLAGR